MKSSRSNAKKTFLLFIVSFIFVASVTAKSSDGKLELSEDTFLSFLTQEPPSSEWEGLWCGSIFDDDDQEIPVTLTVICKEGEWKIEADLFAEMDDEMTWSLSENKLYGEAIVHKAGSLSNEGKKLWLIRRIYLELLENRIEGWWTERAVSSPSEWTEEEITRIKVEEKNEIEFDRMP